MVHGVLWYANVECEILRTLVINDLVADTSVLLMPQQISSHFLQHELADPELTAVSAERLDESRNSDSMMTAQLWETFVTRVTWPAVSSEMGFATKSMMSLCSKEYGSSRAVSLATRVLTFFWRVENCASTLAEGTSRSAWALTSRASQALTL